MYERHDHPFAVQSLYTRPSILAAVEIPNAVSLCFTSQLRISILSRQIGKYCNAFIIALANNGCSFVSPIHPWQSTRSILTISTRPARPGLATVLVPSIINPPPVFVPVPPWYELPAATVLWTVFAGTNACVVVAEPPPAPNEALLPVAGMMLPS